VQSQRLPSRKSSSFVLSLPSSRHLLLLAYSCRRFRRESLPIVRRVVCPCHAVTNAPWCVTPLRVSLRWLAPRSSLVLHSIVRLYQVHCQMVRGTHTAAILGPELYSRLPNTRVLLVGAGGIGCELCESPLSHNSRHGILEDPVRCSRRY